MIATRVDFNSEAFHANASYMRALADELKQRMSIAAQGGDESARRKHTERGKLLARERIDALLDPGAPFLELSPLAADGMYDGGAPAAGVITGIGRIHGTEVVVVANDATVKGSGSHDKTGRHCLPNDPNGKLKIAHHAGFWLRDSYGNLTKRIRHICWDGCMFPNETMMKPQTWTDILKAMIDVRAAHGWSE